MRKLKSGIKILSEIEGYGDEIHDCGRFDAVLKYYRNKGDPLEFNTVLQDPIPYIDDKGVCPIISWHPPRSHLSHVVFERNAWLARQADLIPGVYYSIIGMKKTGYRRVSIPPHLFARSLSSWNGLDKDAIIKMEIFILDIRDTGMVKANES